MLKELGIIIMDYAPLVAAISFAGVAVTQIGNIIVEHIRARKSRLH